MPIFTLDSTLRFPSPEWADPDGLLAMGGDLSVERLLLAYRQGIFPWFEGQTPLWWSPDPRFVLYPEEVRISNSMKQVTITVRWTNGVARSNSITTYVGQYGIQNYIY